MGALIIFGIIALIAILYVMVGFTIVQQSETRVVERLGKYHRTLQSGINFILPIIDRARPVYSRYERNGLDGTVVVTKLSDKIDLREQVYDFPKQSVITKDNVTTTINALLYFQIVEPVKAVYEIDNLPNAIEKLTQYLNLDINKTVAIGDYNNDISMFNVAKIGIAVSNACKETKEAADYITVSNEENAIAKVICDLDSGKYAL